MLKPLSTYAFAMMSTAAVFAAPILAQDQAVLSLDVHNWQATTFPGVTPPLVTTPSADFLVEEVTERLIPDAARVASGPGENLN